MPVDVSLADSVADLVIGLVNYEVIISGSSTGLREVGQVAEPASARCSSMWPN